jgi:hypothetical protein
VTSNFTSDFGLRTSDLPLRLWLLLIRLRSVEYNPTAAKTLWVIRPPEPTS